MKIIDMSLDGLKAVARCVLDIISTTAKIVVSILVIVIAIATITVFSQPAPQSAIMEWPTAWLVNG